MFHHLFLLFLLGMSSTEVTRYFISSLQLANTNNIEVCGVKPGEISNDTFEIKLLNRDRYHEHISDFQAPSKETLQDRLNRLCDQQTNEQVKIFKLKLSFQVRYDLETIFFLDQFECYLFSPDKRDVSMYVRDFMKTIDDVDDDVFRTRRSS